MSNLTSFIKNNDNSVELKCRSPRHPEGSSGGRTVGIRYDISRNTRLGEVHRQLQGVAFLVNASKLPCRLVCGLGRAELQLCPCCERTLRSLKLGDMKPAKHQAPAPCVRETSQNPNRCFVLAAVCLTVAAIAVAAACSCSHVRPYHSSLLSLLQQQRGPGQFTSCRQLSGQHKQLCEAYHSSSGEDKWLQAAAWRQASPSSCEC